MNWIRKQPFKNRIGLFDFYKGILIILIIPYHIWNLWTGGVPRVLRTAVVMVSFFILSGYGFKPVRTGESLKKQAKQLLFPYFLVAAACVGILVLKNIVRGRPAIFRIMPYLLGFIFAPDRVNQFPFEIREISIAWFFLALFLSWNLLNLILNRIKERRKQIGLMILLTAGGMSLTMHSPWIWCIPQTLLATPLLYIGYLMKQERFFRKKLSIWQLTVLGIVWGISVLFGEEEMALNIWRLGLLDYAGSVAGAVLLIKGYTCLELPENRITEAVMSIGRYTYWIVCLHGIDMTAVKWETYIRYAGIPFPCNILMHIVLDSLFIAAGCVILNFCGKLRYHFQNERRKQK